VSEFTRRFDKALQAVGYPLGAFAYELASMPLPPDGDFDEMLRSIVGYKSEAK
jgi:hypothetical protein